MMVDQAWAKLEQVRKAVGSEPPARVRQLLMDAEDAMLEAQRETLRLMSELEAARSLRRALPIWEQASERRCAQEPRAEHGQVRFRRMIAGRAEEFVHSPVAE